MGLFKRKKNKDEFIFKGEKFLIVDRDIWRVGETSFVVLGQIRHEGIIYLVMINAVDGKVYIEQLKETGIYTVDEIKSRITFRNDMVEDDELWQKLVLVAEKSGLNTPCRRVLARELIFGENDPIVRMEKQIYCKLLRGLFDGVF